MIAINGELKTLETCWLQAKCDFNELDDYFIEGEEFDVDGSPVENTREAKCVRVNDTYMDLRQELFMVKETLEATTETPTEITNTYLAEPIKHQRKIILTDTNQKE